MIVLTSSNDSSPNNPLSVIGHQYMVSLSGTFITGSAVVNVACDYNGAFLPLLSAIASLGAYSIVYRTSPSP